MPPWRGTHSPPSESGVWLKLESRVMKFAAIIEYIQDKAKIAEVRPAHRQYLTGLIKQGQLAATGPFTDDSGALIIYEAATKESNTIVGLKF